MVSFRAFFHSAVPILGIRKSFLCFWVCQCFGASPLAWKCWPQNWHWKGHWYFGRCDRRCFFKPFLEASSFGHSGHWTLDFLAGTHLAGLDERKSELISSLAGENGRMSRSSLTKHSVVLASSTNCESRGCIFFALSFYLDIIRTIQISTFDLTERNQFWSDWV